MATTRNTITVDDGTITRWVRTHKGDAAEGTMSHWEATVGTRGLTISHDPSARERRYSWSVWGGNGLHIAGGTERTLSAAKATAEARNAFYTLG